MEQQKNIPSIRYLLLTTLMILTLLTLINVSFKIIDINGLTFTATSLLSPLMAFTYLHIIKNHSVHEQRMLLHISMISLYLFCIGTYLLINLPAAEYMHGNKAYQIVFDNIPKKFFATTFAFGLSFYIPHLLLSTRKNTPNNSIKAAVILTLISGIVFFSLNFLALFSESLMIHFQRTFIDSSIITMMLLMISTCIFLVCSLNKKERTPSKNLTFSSTHHYFLGLVLFSVIVTLICLSCEYRLIHLIGNFNIEASSIFFPFILIASTLMQTHFGRKANGVLISFVIGSTILFSILLIGIIMLPSPRYFNLTLFYKTIMPERMIANACGFIVVLISNSCMLSLLDLPKKWTIPLSIRFTCANIFSITMLWFFNMNVLFPAIYPHDLVNILAVDGFTYKLIMFFLIFPLLMYLNRTLSLKTVPVMVERNVF